MDDLKDVRARLMFRLFGLCLFHSRNCAPGRGEGTGEARCSREAPGMRVRDSRRTRRECNKWVAGYHLQAELRASVFQAIESQDAATGNSGTATGYAAPAYAPQTLMMGAGCRQA
jgi:hypothetical protein